MKWSRLPESVDVIISHIIGACSILWFVLFINNSPNNTPDMSYYCHWEKEREFSRKEGEAQSVLTASLF